MLLQGCRYSVQPSASGPFGWPKISSKFKGGCSLTAVLKQIAVWRSLERLEVRVEWRRRWNIDWRSVGNSDTVFPVPSWMVAWSTGVPIDSSCYFQVPGAWYRRFIFLLELGITWQRFQVFVTPFSLLERRFRSAKGCCLSIAVYISHHPRHGWRTRPSSHLFRCFGRRPVWVCTHVRSTHTHSRGSGRVCSRIGWRYIRYSVPTQLCHYNPRFRACLARHSIPLRLLPARPSSAHFYINHVLVRSWLLFSIFLPRWAISYCGRLGTTPLLVGLFMLQVCDANPHIYNFFFFYLVVATVKDTILRCFLYTFLIMTWYMVICKCRRSNK